MSPSPSSRRFQPIRLLQTLSSYLVFAVGGALCSWLILPVAWCCGGPLAQRRRRCQRILGAALSFFHWHMRYHRILDFNPRTVPLDEFAGTAGSNFPGPVVMIANHPTLIDTTALLSSVRYLCCISNPSFYRNPILTPLLMCCGHINAGKGDIGAGLQVIETAIERLKAGHSLLIFPEGTRSPSHGLRAFRRGAFEIALRAGVPIQPVLIEVSSPVLNHQLPWYWMPEESVRYSLSALPLVRPEELLQREELPQPEKLVSPQENQPAQAVTARRICEEMSKTYAIRLGLS
ncbi:MAG TPA: lysophospholipid acyltransferase family protein [Polyangiaceae bacterium]|nr:lysophospholipid acyltransferase family protein [Polyangiaceae bacterium]